MTTAPRVPLCVADIGDEEIAAVTAVLRSGWLAHGPSNHAFEEAFASYLGVPHAVSLNACASALHLGLLARGVRGEVILPSFTFVASANAVETAGASCVFADVEAATGNLDPDAVEAAITPRTEALMVVHFAGLSADMVRLSAIAKKHHLLLLEDSAEALGASQDGILTGQWSDACFSFYPTKNITTGEGGMFTTRDASVAERVRALSAHGIAASTFQREKSERPWLRAATLAGYNFRMSSLAAALGVVQLKKLAAMNAARRAHAARYREALDPTFFTLPVEPPGFEHVYQMYTVRLRGVERTGFLADLRAAGVGASVHFDPPVHQQPYYAEHPRRGPLTVTEALAASLVTLPLYPGMSPDDVAWVAHEANRIARIRRVRSP